MTKGYRNGFFAILGCFLADAVFITLGAISAKAVVSAIPVAILTFLTLFAGCFLAKIAYGFYKTDVSKIRIQQMNKINVAVTLKMFILTFSSPLSIIGYGAIFSQVIDSETSIVSTISGGLFASMTTHSLIVCTFASIGKRINSKLLSILNKISALWIGGFSCLLLLKFLREVFEYIQGLI